MNDLSKVGHQESGQVLHGLLTPVLVILPLSPEVTEGKGFGASMGP